MISTILGNVTSFLGKAVTAIAGFLTKYSTFFLPFFLGCVLTFVFCWFNPRTITNTLHTENSTVVEKPFFGDIPVVDTVTGNTQWGVKPKDPKNKNEADIELVDAKLGVATFAAVNNKGEVYDNWVMQPSIKTNYFFKDNKLTQNQTISFEGKINIDGIINKEIDQARKKHSVGIGQLNTTTFIHAGTEIKKNVTLSIMGGQDWKEEKKEFGAMGTWRF